MGAVGTKTQKWARATGPKLKNKMASLLGPCQEVEKQDGARKAMDYNSKNDRSKMAAGLSTFYQGIRSGWTRILVKRNERNVDGAFDFFRGILSGR